MLLPILLMFSVLFYFFNRIPNDNYYSQWYWHEFIFLLLHSKQPLPNNDPLASLPSNKLLFLTTSIITFILGFRAAAAVAVAAADNREEQTLFELEKIFR